MKPKIVVIGSLNMDLIIKAERMPKMGESLIGDDFRMVPGGKGANQAMAAAKLGAEVVLLGRVGRDIFGEKIIASLSQGGVNTDYIIKDSFSATGVGLVVVDYQGRNSALVAAGANMACKEEDVDTIRDVIVESDVLLLQLEVPLCVVMHAVDVANIVTILDPAPACPVPLELFQKVDIVIPNQVEAEFFTKQEVIDIETATIAAHEFLKMGALKVIIKLGDKGALLLTGEGKVYVEGIKVYVVDTTAAGDAFAGGLAVALAKGWGISKALFYANYVGALSVTKFGAQSSMPTAFEVECLRRRYEKFPDN